ncbi:MAG: hypothetical protein RLZ07_1654 [Pseudomonadota bacterium]
MSYPQNAYAKVASTGSSQRELEAAALMKAAVRLKAVQDQWDTDHSDLDAALAYNRKLWTILATSATEAESPLPADLQRNISLIAIFIFNRSLDLIVEPKREDLDVLIEINRNIAAGLQVIPKAAA